MALINSVGKDNAAVDADGVVLNFLHAWEVACKEKLGREVVTTNSSYDLSERYEISHREKNIVWEHFYAADLWRTLPMFTGADKAIQSLVDAGMNVHIVTAIDEELRDARMFNFLTYGIVDYTMHCTGHTKADKLLEVAPVVFFDDNPAHHTEALAAGVPNRILIANHPESIAEHATARFESLEQATAWFLNHRKTPEHPLRSHKL